MPGKERQLTDLEQEFREICEEIMVPHYVVTTAEEAVAILVERRGRSH